MKSPFFKKVSNKITAIEITIKRENGDDTFVAFIRPEKIKDLIENEQFFKDLKSIKDKSIRDRIVQKPLNLKSKMNH